MVRRERRYTGLPQAGQRRNLWFEESAAFSEALPSSPMRLAVATLFPDFTDSGDLS
jgi:hypothetical protein